MKIVLIHHFYRSGSSSGENNVVQDHIQALRNDGHEVTLIGRNSNQTLNSWMAILKVGVTWALNLGNNPWKGITEVQPDIVIIHNLYPGFTSRWLRKGKFPTIYWLHNYRLFCIAASFLYRNQKCLICAKSISYKAIARKCTDGSIWKSLSSFLRLRLNPILPETSEPDYWVTLSPKSHDLFLKTSLNVENLKIIPNFVDSNFLPARIYPSKWVFVGTLTARKGILNLIKNFPVSIELDVFGDGPMLKEIQVECENKTNVHLKGNMDRKALLQLLPNYCGGFLPSLWTEAIPTTFLEFSAAGLPVIGWETNSTSDFIQKYGNGLVLKTFGMNEISAAVEIIVNNRNTFSKNSLRMWELEFSEKVWINRVNDLFKTVLEQRKPR